MRKPDALKYFGTTIAVASVLGVSQPAVSRWGEIIPEKQAMRLALITNGELLYRPELYRSTETIAAV